MGKSISEGFFKRPIQTTRCICFIKKCEVPKCI